MSRSDDAGDGGVEELRALDAEHMDRLAEIQAGLDAMLAFWDQNPVLAPDAYLSWRPMTLEEARAEAARLRREEGDRYHRELETLKLRQSFDKRTDGEAPENHYGKEYPGALVEAVVRQAAAAQRDGQRLAHTFRERLAEETASSPHMVRMVFRLMQTEPPALADANKKGWLKVGGVTSPTPSWINLHALETRS
jgi:hypothetical protein